MTMTDDTLIKKILAGEKDKYELLMRKYNQRLYRICKGYLTEEDEIEDVMQDAYIKGYQQLGKFENRSMFSTWLIRILINECLMRLRQKKKMAAVPYNEDDLNIENLLIDYEHAEQKIMKSELKNMLENAVQSLPEKYKSVFIMREVESMSVAETSEVLEITESNVKVRLNRAKEMLRENLLKAAPASELFDFNLVRCDRIVANVFARI
jgi:RNA polymerase sigma factor (sigma-70 family)